MANEGLPTRDEIARLPRWARVAFAARCARRAQVVLLKQSPEALEKHILAIDQAIELAETAAANAKATDDSIAFKAHSRAISAAAVDNKPTATAAAATAYAFAAAAAEDDSDTIANTAKSLTRAAETGVIPQDINDDFNFLLQLSQMEQWSDTTPIPPSVFTRPLAESPPTSAHESSTSVETIENDETIRVKLRFLGKPGVTAQELAPHIRATYQALNHYTLAKYGTYLKLTDFKRLMLKYAGVPV